MAKIQTLTVAKIPARSGMRSPCCARWKRRSSCLCLATQGSKPISVFQGT